MNQFVFTIKDNNQKAFNTFFWFLYCLHAIVFSIIILNTSDKYQKNVTLFTAFLFSFCWFSYPYFKEELKYKKIQGVLFLLMIAFWVVQLAWLPAIIVIGVIWFAYFILNKKSTVLVTEAGVSIQRSLFKKELSWAVIENVVLKDNLLSVDLKNNHLIQLELAGESTTLDEAVFKKFCGQQLQTLNS